MRADWTQGSIGELLSAHGGDIKTGPFGTKLKAAEYTLDGVPVISVGEVHYGRLTVHDDTPRVNESVTSRMPEYLLREGDIVFGRKGAVDRSARVRADQSGWFLGSDGIRLRLPDSCDSAFVAYQLQHEVHRAWMLQHAAGSTMPSLNEGIIRRIPIVLPPLPEQRTIAAVLCSLDDKIEQNRQTGRALERLARATFNAWFVDFGPVKAKSAGAASFPGMPPAAFAGLPDRLTESSTGPVPQGWEVSNIGTVAQRIAMGPFGSDIKTDNFVSDGVPVIRGGNLTDGFVDRDFVFLTESKADQLANANAFPGDIVITHRGTLGQIGLIPARSRYKRYVVSQSQMLIRPNAAMLPSHFLYLFLTSSAGQYELLANRSQTGVPAISRPTTSLKAISLILPQRPVVDAFEGFASTLFDARAAAEDESQKLAALRDYLLPRLLRGQVTVRSPRH